jgi:phosphate-selective porin OprO/OprP
MKENRRNDARSPSTPSLFSRLSSTGRRPGCALWSLVIAGALLFAVQTPAQDTNTLELIKQLQQRIDDLEQKVKNLEQEKERAAQVSTNEVKNTQRLEELNQKVNSLQQDRAAGVAAYESRLKAEPQISIGADGFYLASSNNDFVARLSGVLQIDSRTFFHDAGEVGDDALLLRRARPILSGTVFRDFDFLFVPDFGGSTVQIFDALVNYRYSQALQLQAGKFKSPVGLEQLQQDRNILFNERALPTDLVPNRDIGFELHGDLFEGTVGYAAGIFNGVGDARLSSNTSFQDDKSFAGRLFFLPFKNTSYALAQQFGFGLSGSYESAQATNTLGLPNTTGGSLPGFTTDGQQQFFAYNPTNKSTVVDAGDHWRISPQGYYYYGPFGMFGEYVISDQAVSRTGAGRQPTAALANTAWEVSGSWLLTGEQAVYNGDVVPRHSFDPAHGGWGAFQLVGRYAELNVDSAAFPNFADPTTSARSITEWAAGFNWYLNRNVRFDTSFSHATFQGGGGAGTSAPGVVTRRPENVLFTRLQLAF